jgi:hypothetical protein
MNVKQLRELLATAPDDAPVLTSGPDHSYSLVTAHLTTAAVSRERSRTYYAEWCGKENASPGETPIKAVVLT